MTKTYDVAVIGAGLAGLRTGLGLARAGARVLLVERRRDLARGIRTTGIFVRRTLEDFAFPAGTLGPAIRHVALYSPAGRALALESRRCEFRVGAMGALYRRELEACEAAGVEWAGGTRLERIEATSPRLVLRLRSGRRAWTASARFVVGADGARSRVAAEVGLDENRRWLVGAEEVLHGVPLGGPPSLHCFLDPVRAPGYLAWVVNDGAETHVGVAGHGRGYDPAAALRSFRAEVTARFGLARGRVVERRGGLIPVGGVLRRLACARGLLVGDAAGAVSPLTAGGLDPCLRLSAHAASVAAAWLDTGDVATLAAYDGADFRRRYARRLALRRVMDRVSTPAAAELAHAALRTPFLRPLAARVFFGNGSFPEVAHTPMAAPAGRI